MPTLAFATDSRHPNGGDDDTDLRACLTEAGISVELPVWDDPNIDWKKYDLILPRSIWDYPSKHPAFLTWLERLKRLGAPVQNPTPLLAWNSNKVYLKELSEAGVPVLKTRWEAPKSKSDLEEIVGTLSNQHEWILKPSVSSGADLTLRYHPAQTGSAKPVQGWINSWVGEKLNQKDCLLMIQRFEKEILKSGETSLLYFGGIFQYAIRKQAQGEDFRTQPNFGAKLTQVKATDDQLNVGNQVLKHVHRIDKTLYARVDLIQSEGKPACIEAELVEPNLFLRYTDSKQNHLALAAEIKKLV
ncbi:MAG: hypothetical protein JNL01_08175 [Bdellovibrionales bacterium]|nr:hypothetical protein [Bdellovibrionales bacterium]